MIGLVVDSSSQMSAELATRLRIAVVPLTVTVNGIDHLEGVDLDADAFYGEWADGYQPEISTSQPSPGQFVEAYQRLADAGATDILSVHITATMSGTLNSARLATGMVDVPVRLVDSGTASFGVSCCAWAAADVITAGGDLEEAAAKAESQAASLHTSFVVGVPRLTDRSGRADGVGVEAAAEDGVPVIAMTGSDISVLATATDLIDAVEIMVDDALARPATSDAGLRIAIGTSDESSRPMSVALTETLERDSRVAELIQYRIGPSVGAHTGPGTSGLFVS